MASVHAEFLKSDLRAIAGDVEQLMQDMAATAGEETRDLQARLQRIRERVTSVERTAGERIGRTVARGNRYAHENLWMVVGGVALAALAVGLLGGRARD